ncbi:MAG: hypothetical protein V4657_02950, partial [Pseudomonadota bacterium]
MTWLLTIIVTLNGATMPHTVGIMRDQPSCAIAAAAFIVVIKDAEPAAHVTAECRHMGESA